MKPIRYANPVHPPQAERAGRYVPTGGMQIAGEFYQGGEHLEPDITCTRAALGPVLDKGGPAEGVGRCLRLLNRPRAAPASA
jgi:hypothetical protein